MNFGCCLLDVGGRLASFLYGFRSAPPPDESRTNRLWGPRGGGFLSVVLAFSRILKNMQKPKEMVLVSFDYDSV